MTSEKKIGLLKDLKKKGITSSKQFAAMDARSLIKMCGSISSLNALLDLQDALKGDKSGLFDFLMTDDEEFETTEGSNE